MQNGQKTAFVFAGGGSLGAIQVGMLRVLLSGGLHADFVIGSSVGAINAAYFAGAPNDEGVVRLAQIWCGLRRGDVFPFTFFGAVGFLRHPDYIVNPSLPPTSSPRSIGLRPNAADAQAGAGP
jgi:NTE family protein